MRMYITMLTQEHSCNHCKVSTSGESINVAGLVSVSRHSEAQQNTSSTCEYEPQVYYDLKDNLEYILI